MSIWNQWVNDLKVWFMMERFRLKNTMFFPTVRNSFVVWKTLRSVNRAHEAAVRERLVNNNGDGIDWSVYSISGGGVVADRTVVVPVNESLD
tara:strand:+ start:170 stop:445 length:276 start_codon:yes stop_codon:yes gene_type:complete